MRNVALVIVAIVNILITGNSMAKDENKNSDAKDVPKVVSVKSRSENIDAIELSRVLPVEYAKYKKQVTGKYDVNDCNSVFALISSARGSLVKSQKSSAAKKRDYRKAYSASWRECLKMKQKSKDPSVQKLILKKWNNFLIEDSNDVPFQIYALATPMWDRDFLTDNFWKLLQQSDNRNTIAAISYVLCMNGNQEDVKQLIKRHKPEVDMQLRGIINNAVSHMRHRLWGDKNNPGPASRGPVMTFEDIPPQKYEKKVKAPLKKPSRAPSTKSVGGRKRRHR